jgi:hypothetical protein
VDIFIIEGWGGNYDEYGLEYLLKKELFNMMNKYEITVPTWKWSHLYAGSILWYARLTGQ